MKKIIISSLIVSVLSASALYAAQKGSMEIKVPSLEEKKTKCLSHLKEMESCVSKALSIKDMKDCKATMKSYMKPHKGMAKCGAGKCGKS